MSRKLARLKDASNTTYQKRRTQHKTSPPRELATRGQHSVPGAGGEKTLSRYPAEVRGRGRQGAPPGPHGTRWVDPVGWGVTWVTRVAERLDRESPLDIPCLLVQVQVMISN